jgi:flagellin
MSLSILNNIAALYAQNNLASTTTNLQATLQQLSSGSRLNSGADDPAGLAISDGMGANIAALTQSAINAADGIGLLQTADGALSQVTSLLDQAVSLSTEASNGTLTTAQVSSANQEYQNILTQIGNIGSGTNFNSSQVFTNNATNLTVTDGTQGGLYNYANVIGALSTASVGTTAAAATTTSSVTPVQVAPITAVTNTAGQYTLTANAATDTLNGTLSFTTGSATTPTNVSIAANSTLTQVKNDLIAAGLGASLSGSVITITGPTNGVNASANTLNFTSDLSDSPATTALGVGSGSLASPATSTTSSITFGSGAVLGDTLSGNITFQVASGSVQTFTLAGGTTLDANATTGIVTQLNNNAAFQAAGLTASINSSGTPVLTVTGPSGSSSTITLGTGTVADLTHTGVTATTQSFGGVADAGVEELELHSSNDIFGAGATLSVGGQTIDLSSGTETVADVVSAINNPGSIANLAGYSAEPGGANEDLWITGPSDGSPISIVTGGAFNDSTGHAILTDVLSSGVPGSSAQSTLAIKGSPLIGDSLTGAISWSQNANSGSLTLAAGSTLTASGANSIITQLNNNVAFHTTAGLTASLSGANIVVTGTDGVQGFITLTAPTLVDTTHPTQSLSNDITTGAAGTVGSYALAALGSSSDTYGTGVANTIDINGTQMSIAGLTATATELAINQNAAYAAMGVTASVNGSGTQVTIHGNPNGSALTVHGDAGGTIAFTDQAPNDVAITSIAQTVAPTGNPAAGATSTITFGSTTDTIGGTLAMTVNSGGSAKSASINVAAGTTGQALANAINQSAQFQTANLTANWNSTTGKVVITGPTGAGNTIATTGTSLTDTSSTNPGAGANFTLASDAILTAATAGTILTTATQAVADVAYQRGTVGADINELTSADGVARSESLNISSANDSISATDYGQAATQLSKYQILSQTGISALAQANSVQQEVLKLLQ